MKLFEALFNMIALNEAIGERSVILFYGAKIEIKTFLAVGLSLYYLMTMQ